MNAKVNGRSARGRPRFGWMDGVKRALNDRGMGVREASKRARDRNEWRMIVTQFWLASAVVAGLPYRGNPVVGAVGEVAYMKRRKLWKTGRMGCVAPAVPSKLGWVPLHCQKNGVKSPLFYCFFCVVGYPPNWGKRPRYIDRYLLCLILFLRELYHNNWTLPCTHHGHSLYPKSLREKGKGRTKNNREVIIMPRSQCISDLWKKKYKLELPQEWMLQPVELLPQTLLKRCLSTCGWHPWVEWNEHDARQQSSY